MPIGSLEFLTDYQMNIINEEFKKLEVMEYNSMLLTEDELTDEFMEV